MNKLSQENQAKAAAFIAAQARPLEQALYDYYFRAGTAEAVLAALAAFQNEDGGFGRGLEPDLQVPESSVLATTVALQTLRALGAGSDHPLVQGAIGYLVKTFVPEHNLWYIRPDCAADGVCAPWWQRPWAMDTLRLNPRAEIVGYLYDYQTLVPGAMLRLVTNDTLEDIGSQGEPLDMHSLLCMIRLLDTKNLPDRLREVVWQRVAQEIPQAVELSPEKWNAYNLKPLQIAPSPKSLFADEVRDALPANLDYVIAQQQADGSWAPAWSWGDAFPEAWAEARRQWQGKLTVETLKMLRDHGRFA